LVCAFAPSRRALGYKLALHSQEWLCHPTPGSLPPASGTFTGELQGGTHSQFAMNWRNCLLHDFYAFLSTVGRT
jgi:hypothetical protein